MIWQQIDEMILFSIGVVLCVQTLISLFLLMLGKGFRFFKVS